MCHNRVSIVHYIELLGYNQEMRSLLDPRWKSLCKVTAIVFTGLYFLLATSLLSGQEYIGFATIAIELILFPLIAGVFWLLVIVFRKHPEWFSDHQSQSKLE